jgi:hypothetical protein
LEFSIQRIPASNRGTFEWLTLIWPTAKRKFLKLENGHPDYLLKLMNLMQANTYVEIMRRDPTQERFARGWLNRVDLK